MSALFRLSTLPEIWSVSDTGLLILLSHKIRHHVFN